MQTCSTTDSGGGVALDRAMLVELRRAALQEIRAIEAYLKGKIDTAALQRELRRVDRTRAQASHV